MNCMLDSRVKYCLLAENLDGKIPEVMISRDSPTSRDNGYRSRILEGTFLLFKNLCVWLNYTFTPVFHCIRLLDRSLSV